MTGNVVCRCTTKCHVKILENQWFIDYKNEEWKQKSKEHLSNMTIEPEIARTQFQNTIDWLEYKACARKSGFGTKLPFDKHWIVETLSDSTIYNAYYTISRFVNNNKISEEQLTDEVLDYIFLNNEKPSIENTDIINEMKEEFEHFYPVDMRGSGKDLIQNHLTFFIMQHVALFHKKHWPKGISVNGYVNVEGEKMAKSKGNVIPLRELMEKHGPDFVRIGMVASTEGMDDANWSESNLSGYETRLNYIESLIQETQNYESNFKVADIKIQDKMLLYIIEESKKKAYSHYEQLKLRSAAFESFFTVGNAIKSYQKYGLNKQVLNHAIKEFLIINSPLIPYSAEFLYSKMTGESIMEQLWPQEITYNFAFMEEKIALYNSLKQDIEAVINLVNKKGSTAVQIKLILAEEWAYEMLRMKNEPLSEMMKNEKIREKGQLASKLYPKIKIMKWNLGREEEEDAIREIIPLLEQDIELPIIMQMENKEKQGIPGKPGILIEESK
jgi:leucyl-tRNA synthetase